MRDFAHYLLCDSGFGQLDIAARMIRRLRSKSRARHVHLTCFNAWPEVGRGYNQMADDAEKERVFRGAFEAMLSRGADLNIFACNTLSVICRRSDLYGRYREVIRDIPDAAGSMMCRYLLDHPGHKLMILGTLTTVGSGYYRQALQAGGIAPERIYELSCPGLATLIESGPQSPEVESFIRSLARYAKGALQPECEVLALGLCCTHYGYSSSLLERIFSEELGTAVTLVNPNEAMLDQPDMSVLFDGGCGAQKIDVEVVSRIPVGREKMVALSPFFEPDAPELARGLCACCHDPELFTWKA